ncbi:hypothetical protein [Nocardia asteroides]|uniref:hypothetical protein n=1 Tax=Nocardia asteroides TaxID=1824 RepID=UPI001E2E9E8F|nr:hypothetical protein [Nocardia asteroides]UGT53969.1 hypothetical protein LTT85_25400 [Nocardia asteroides]
MTTQYDPPGITDPENVDGLTHQQIVDAFSVVANSTSELVKVWKQADADLSASTEAMLTAVRGALDGGWTGSAADAAVMTVARYCDDASRLPELFDEVSLVVSNTALTAVMTKSFLPPVVSVTADRSSDPEGFDRQTREADTAQAEARRIMAERYVVGFQDQDARLPTFPDAMAIGNDQSPQIGPGTSGGPGSPTSPGNPVAGEPVGTDPEENDSGETTEQDPANTGSPTGTKSEDSSTSDGSTSAAGQDDSTQAASAAPASAPTGSTPSTSAPSAPGDAPRTATPSGGGPAGGVGVPGGQRGGSAVPSPGASTPLGSTGVGGASPGARGAVPAAAYGGGAGMHGAPGAAGRGGRGDDQEKADKKVSLTHGDNTTELLGVIKHVPPVIGDR